MGKGGGGHWPALELALQPHDSIFLLSRGFAEAGPRPGEPFQVTRASSGLLANGEEVLTTHSGQARTGQEVQQAGGCRPCPPGAHSGPPGYKPTGWATTR